MPSRRAKILVPLAVEIAFALIVFAAIRLTDGGRYGLGAKAVLKTLVARYQNCMAYEAEISDAFGDYADLKVSGGCVTERCAWVGMRQMRFFYRRPDQFACTAFWLQGNWFFTQIGRAGTVMPPEGWGASGAVDLSPGPLEANFPWEAPMVYWFLRPREKNAAGLPSMGEYAEVLKRRAPDGTLCTLLVLWRKGYRRELWINPETGGLRACVFPDAERPYHELYRWARFDAPVDREVFNGGAQGLKRLEQCVKERESGPTE